MQENPNYEDVVEEILDYLRRRSNVLQDAGVHRDRICLDPGIGFGKTHDHNLQLLESCERFHELGGPILIGHSRKALIGKITSNRSSSREWGSVGMSLALARKQIQILRLHDVGATRDALVCFQACCGLS